MKEQHNSYQTIKNRWADCCRDSTNFYFRKVAVETQFQRNVWELDDRNGRIMIMHNGSSAEKGKIILWHVARYIQEHDIKQSPYEIEISFEQYRELELMFFGEFKENKKYLKMLKHVLRENTIR